MSPPDPILAALARTFGYASFRPLQEDIIRDALAGRDVIALLPTGAGKSLCFQLPAVLRDGLTVVVSPLIALMKDQVDGLTEAGVAATYLNSSLDADDAKERIRGLRQRRYRLLYVAPERLVMPGFVAMLRDLDVTAVAVDEAHCISAWGHDFRPEYRAIGPLRDLFPDAPFMALTATATARVRDDIAASLRLRDPRSYIGSFDRPNLLYRVEEKSDAYARILALVRSRPDASGIVYALSRAGTSRLAERLAADGVGAAAYHAGLDPKERARVQEAFVRDDVRVVCATVAFGMGIDKPDVRFVVHHDLPRDLESYYQETGRAGRDGLPSECLLLYNPGDAAKQDRFIEEKSDPDERARAREKLARMVAFAESPGCRRAALLAYFGEARTDARCGACDNCLAPRETWDGTRAAHKLLSCVVRIRQKSGHGVGLAHVVDVLLGSDREKVHRLGHARLSTYGIGRELGRAEWKAGGRELARLDLIHLGEGPRGTVEVTARGLAVLQARSPVMLTRKTGASASTDPRALPHDDVLFERLRRLRREIADARDVPAYVVFSDVALQQMAREYPTDPQSFRRISGVGERKLADLGEAFTGAIAEHVAEHGKKELGAMPTPEARPLNDTTRESLRRFRAGESIAEIADARGLVPSTIYSHLAAAIEAGEAVDLDRALGPAAQHRIAEVFAAIGDRNLEGALERLGDGFDHGKLRLFRAARSPGAAARPAPC